MAPRRLVLLAVAALLALACQPAAARVDWTWRQARVTHYGGVGDPWSIHHGSCKYGYLDPTVNKGFDVAALTDAVSDYPGSCGRCYEIGCAPMHLKDGYGTGLDRTHVCYDSSQTVTLMITDTCPCNYPANAYSNKRWCCGDMVHFDVSAWAFEKLADKKYGVIGVRYREVPCDHCPDNPALLPKGHEPARASEGPPGGWQSSWDKRPWAKMCFKTSTERQDGGGQQDQGDSSKKDQGGSGGGDSSRRLFPANSLLTGWQQDFGAALGGGPWTAPDGRSAYCGTLAGGAGLSFKSPSGGSLFGKRTLSIDIKTSQGQVPDIRLQLASSQKGKCRAIDLRSVHADKDGDWARLSVPLINADWFAWTNGDVRDFGGCSHSIEAWDVDVLEFENKGGKQSLCLANVKAS